MGTQTMTETHAGTVTKGWAREETNIGVVVKRSAGVFVAFADWSGRSTSIGMTMTQADAIEYARAIMAAATGVDCTEDRFEFQATKDARKMREATAEMEAASSQNS